MYGRKLNLLSWNARSLYHKLSHFKTNLDKYNPHVVCLSETWIRDNRIPCFKNYETYLCNRVGSVGGGIAILVRLDLIYVELPLIPFRNGMLEIQAIIIKS